MAETSAITSIDGAVDQINSARATRGEAMNHLVHAGDNAANVSQKLNESSSHIINKDYAQVIAEMASSLILNEASSIMVSQANQQPYDVLALLS